MQAGAAKPLREPGVRDAAAYSYRNASMGSSDDAFQAG